VAQQVPADVECAPMEERDMTCDAMNTLPEPYYRDESCTIYCADCRDVLPLLPKVDMVLTDPPYPNKAGHFNNAIADAEWFIRTYNCPHWFVFWDEMEIPVHKLPLVARHVWYRTNTNRPDNYEAIYEFNADGLRRASRVFAHAVIFPGLTGCKQATGHPTQKNEELITEILSLCKAQTILDPFMGSGTTLRAAKDLGRRAIGIEINPAYCEIAVQRLRQEVLTF
jgi:DNA modification methylase